VHGRLAALLRQVRRLFCKDRPLPGDPYAYVSAPKKPNPPGRGAAIAVEPEP
jgi:hypothetical protein